MPYDLRNSKDTKETVPPVSQGSNDSNNKDNDTESIINIPTSTQENSEEESTTSTNDSNQSESDLQPETHFWTGEPPSRNGTIAKLFTSKENRATTKTHEDLVAFLYNNTDEIKANKLQFDNDLVTFIVAVPNSVRRVRLLYGIGSSIGLTGIHNNDLEDKVLALSGEYEKGIAFPSVLQFPKSALTPITLNTPSLQEFTTELNKNNKSDTWFKYADLSNEADLPMIVPIPAIYISDGFDRDIDAADLFERLRAIPEPNQAKLQQSLQLLRTFLTAVVVNYNKRDPTIFPPITTFMSQTTPLLNKWKNLRMKALFPSITESTTPEGDKQTKQTEQSQPAQAQVTSTSTWTPESFLQAFAALKATSSTASSTSEETKETATKETLGMGTYAYHLLLDLCGLAPGNADEILPLWKQLSEKNLSKADKTSFVRRALENNVKWSEAKILPLNAILTMVVNRTWEGETTLSSLSSAAKGLTPFAVPCLTESEVTTQNDLADALAAASSTTVRDHSSIKLVASAPSSFDGLVKRIKRFGNLIYAIFGENSAMFMQLEDMVTALDSYGEYARNTMSHQTIASILWITHIQSRHYAAGAMKGAKALKAEFTTMMNALMTKTPVLHMDTPPKLYNKDSNNNSNKHNAPTNQQDKDQSPTKKQKPNNEGDRYQLVERNVMNQKMKVAMKPILSLPRIPNMGKICRAARINAGDLFPAHKDICIRSQVLGKCFVSCTHKHIKLSDSEVTNAIKLLESVNANTSLLKVN
jgi:hypothetical protein